MNAVEEKAPAKKSEPRFLADAMLGRLARWLRFLGYDAAYEPAIDDAVLARRARREGRLVLTRDRALPLEHRLTRWLLVDSDQPLEQLGQVVRDLGLDWQAPHRPRCTRCNGVLTVVPGDAVAARIPAYVRSRHEHFAECPDCRRVYWEGTHVERMRRNLHEALS